MEAGTKMVGLIRVSTSDQGRLGLGLEAQEEVTREECRRRRWLFADEIVESAVSGRAQDRPGLTAALDRIGSGQVSGIVVAKLDRISLSVVDFGRILAWLDEAGGYLVARDSNVDPSTPSGRLVANVLAPVAEWEADTISLRTSDALAAQRARGEAVSRTAVPPEVTAKISALRDDGMTYRAICDRSNADGVPTARGAASWSVSAVQRSLGYTRPKRRKTADLPEVPRRRPASR